jgi:hypothetical protein
MPCKSADILEKQMAAILMIEKEAIMKQTASKACFMLFLALVTFQP